LLENITYQQKKEIDALFNFVSTLEIKDTDEALKYETLETEKMGSIYLQACLGTDKFYTYDYTMDDVLNMLEVEIGMETYQRLFYNRSHYNFSVEIINSIREDFCRICNIDSKDVSMSSAYKQVMEYCHGNEKMLLVLVNQDLRSDIEEFLLLCNKILEYAYRGLASNKYFYNKNPEAGEYIYYTIVDKVPESTSRPDDYFTYDDFLQIYEEMRVFMHDKIIDGMENGEFEQNDYYRVLNGKPEVNGQYTFKISNLTSFKRSVLSIEEIPSLTYYDKMILIRDNPDIKFLQNILEPIPISESRLANDYYIIKYNPDYLGKAKTEKFIKYYYENLKMLLLKFHNSALANQPLYKPFLRLFLIFLTMQSYIATALEDFNNIDFFDQDKVTKMFRSYDLDYFSDLPIDYQKIILKNINTLIKYSGSNEIMIDIPNLFGLSNTTIYKYYLVKKTNPGETDPDKYYDIAFAKVPVEVSNPISYLLDSSNYLDYDEVISTDPYWNRSKEELIEALNRDGQRKIDSFNYRLTKYISIISSVDLLKQTQDCNYTIHLIQSLEARAYAKNGDLTKGTSLSFVNSTYKPSGNNRISLIDGIVALNWLILMRGKIDGISLSSTDDSNSTYGAYFAQKITELTEQETDENYKNFYTSYNVLDSNLSEDAFRYNLENHNSIYRWEYEYLTKDSASNETRLVYKHNKRVYNEDGSITETSSYEINRMNLLFAFKEFYDPKAKIITDNIRGYAGSDYQKSALSVSMKTYEGFVKYIKQDLIGRKYDLPLDNEYTFGSKENDQFVEALFNEYDNEFSLREAVDGLLMLYVDKFKAYDYPKNDETTTPSLLEDDYSKMDAFVALYKGFKDFKKDFEQMIISEDNPLVYMFLKRVYYSCMVTEYQEDCYPVLDANSEDKGRLSEFARYLRSKDEVFYSLLIDKINSLLPTDAGASDNDVYRQSYIDRINEIILDLIDSMKAYLNSSEFDNIFNLSDTNTVDSIRFYIQQILEVFKSYTIFIHDVKIDYTFDDKFSEGVKVLMDIYAIRSKMTIVESTEMFGKEANRYFYDTNGNLIYTEYNNKESSYDYEGYDSYKLHKKLPSKDDINVSDKFTYKVRYTHILGEYMLRSSTVGSRIEPTYRLKISPTDERLKFFDLYANGVKLTNYPTPVEEEVILPKAVLNPNSYDYNLEITFYELNDDMTFSDKYTYGTVYFTEPLNELDFYKNHLFQTNKVVFEDDEPKLKSENLKVDVIGKIMGSLL